MTLLRWKNRRPNGNKSLVLSMRLVYRNTMIEWPIVDMERRKRWTIGSLLETCLSKNQLLKGWPMIKYTRTMHLLKATSFIQFPPPPLLSSSLVMFVLFRLIHYSFPRIFHFSTLEIGGKLSIILFTSDGEVCQWGQGKARLVHKYQLFPPTTPPEHLTTWDVHWQKMGALEWENVLK